MPTKTHVVTAILATVVVIDTAKLFRIKRQATELHETIIIAADIMTAQDKTIDYRIDVLQRNEIAMTEFDVIALNNL